MRGGPPLTEAECSDSWDRLSQRCNPIGLRTDVSRGSRVCIPGRELGRAVSPCQNVLRIMLCNGRGTRIGAVGTCTNVLPRTPTWSPGPLICGGKHRQGETLARDRGSSQVAGGLSSASGNLWQPTLLSHHHALSRARMTCSGMQNKGRVSIVLPPFVDQFFVERVSS